VRYWTPPVRVRQDTALSPATLPGKQQ